MQRFIIVFIIVYALHVSGGFSANHQEFKNCTHSICYVPGLLAATASGTTNKIQRFTIFFIIVYAPHISGGFSAHHQELKNCTYSICYVPGLLAATASGM